MLVGIGGTDTTMAQDQMHIRVMIVNDQADATRLWERIINYAPDMSCIGSALDGDEAIVKASDLQPDVLLLDVMMPGLTGYETAERIRQISPGTQIIIFSARRDIEEKAYAAGAAAALNVPVAPKALLDVIRRVHQQRG